MPTLTELKVERKTDVEKLHAILDAADNESRELTAEDQQEYDRIEARVNELGDLIKEMEDAAEQQRLAAERRNRLAQYQEETGRREPDRPRHPFGGGRGEGQTDPPHASYFEFEICGGNQVHGAHRLRFGRQSDEFARAQADYLAAFNRYLITGEPSAALQVTPDDAGGYLVPMQTVAGFIKFVDDAVFIRKYATVIPLPMAKSLGIPTLENDPADADWTSELNIGSEDSTMDFGKRELSPNPLAKFIKLSNKLLRSSAMDVESLVRQRLAYKFGVAEEKGFLTGTGANQPLGVFTASNDGISTSRDVSTGNTTTSIGLDGLIRAKYSLKDQHRSSARWLFHRDGVSQIMRLKDGEGRYQWQPSVREGEPDMLLSIPVDTSEFAPNTFTTGLYVGLLANWSFYYIADALSMTFQRLVELYAATNQTGIIGRREVDGMPVLEEAFARVKLT